MSYHFVNDYMKEQNSSIVSLTRISTDRPRTQATGLNQKGASSPFRLEKLRKSFVFTMFVSCPDLDALAAFGRMWLRVICHTMGSGNNSYVNNRQVKMSKSYVYNVNNYNLMGGPGGVWVH